MMRHEAPQSWRALIDGYAAAHKESLTAETLRVRLARIERFAADVAVEPSALTSEQFDSWAGSLSCSAKTLAMYVQGARALYEWGVQNGHLAASPVPAARASGRRAYTVDDKWRDAIEAFRMAQETGKVAELTVRRRLQHLRRFANASKQSPWLVRNHEVAMWLSRDITHDSSRAAAQDSLRAFYRWAVGKGRIEYDPTLTEGARYRRLGVPTQWDDPLRRFRTYLVARALSDESIALFTGVMDNFARAHASLAPFDATTDDLLEWIAGKGWARDTLRSRYLVLRTYFRWAVATGRSELDPTQHLPRVRAAGVDVRPATQDEYEAALEASKGTPWHLAIRLGYEMGLRRAEIACIHADDLRREADGALYLRVHGKGQKKRNVPVPDRLAPALLEAAMEGYVFANRSGAPYSPQYLGKSVSELLPEGVSTHALRHSFATRKYGHSHDVYALQELLGHASASTTQRYVHVSTSRLRELMNA